MSIRPHQVLTACLHLLLPLLLSLLLSVATHAQNFSAVSPSLTPQNTLSSIASTEFLPVAEAYQLMAEVHGEPAQRQLLLYWQIAPGYYLYGHNLTLEIDGEVIAVDLPEGKTLYDEYYEKELSVFYNQLELKVDISQQTAPFTIKIQSQGCADAGLCYPPQTQWLEVNPLTAETTLTTAAPGTAPANSLPAASNPLQAGLLSAILLAMVGGIILNLMPCVFPILSLKALSLAASSLSPQRQHLHGWTYTAGVISTFIVIAAILFALRSAGQAAGWGFQLQSPLLVALLAYLFVIIGLSLSGMGLSGIISRRNSWAGAGESLTHGHTLKASFFTGALATIVASPCTAPFMGAALGWALVQPAASGLMVFAALGFGMALPFLLLSYLPGLRRLLPKPGRWMETVKQALAFPMYLTAVWLLWVLGRQIGSDMMAALIIGMVMLSFAAWVIQPQPQSERPLSRRSLALFALLLALWPLWHISQANPQQDNLAQSAASDWQAYTPATLQQLLDQGQPVFVNLTADWCITCLANEKIALETSATKAAFKRLGIHRLKGDWTNYNADITALLAQHNRSGVPLYLFYPAGANSQPQILPQLLSERLVIATLEGEK